ncbi:AAA family ATPase [Streptomyces sp. NPDC051109]|uniref:AAA family ATPase n=1 Tax=Streptomyces sp. NPDC051109 TaxID=3365642 RepID=UPI001066FE19
MPVLGAVTDAGAASTPAGPLIGRDTELDQHTRLLAERRRTSKIAVIEGTAGIGKTRLPWALVERAAAAGREVLARE